jgi:L-alanine-DL-glutamate epimerase-like enolase superfamily enzyme
MEITDIVVTELRVPEPGDRAAGGIGLDGAYNTCLIQVMTDAGITGLAEVDSLPSVIRAIVEAPSRINTQMGLKEILLGRDPREPRALWREMMFHTSGYGRRGVVVHAISGLDIALWDIAARAAGKPLAALLGEPRRQRLPGYVTVYPAGGSAEELRRNIDARSHYPVGALKIAADRNWQGNPRLVTELVTAARAHVGDEKELMIDAVTAFDSAAEALALMPVFRDCRVAWLEAPLPLDDIAGHRALKDHGVPIAAGDIGLTAPAEWLPFFDQAEIDIAQPDVTMVGGFTGLMEIAALARARGVRVIPHGWGTNITLACNLHFLAQQDSEEPAEFSTSASPLRWRTTRQEIAFDEAGYLTLPQGPGLGVSLDEDVVARYAVSL